MFINKVRNVLLDKKNIWRITEVIAIFIYSFILMYCCEALSRGTIENMKDFIGDVPTSTIYINCSILIALMILTLRYLTAKISLSVGLVSAVMFIIHIVNFLKTSMRAEPFFPWDITLLSEATNIVGDMNVEIIPVMWWSGAFIVVSVIISVLADIFLTKLYKPRYRFSAAWATLPLALLIILSRVYFSPEYMSSHNIILSMYEQKDNYENYGFIYSFVFNYKNADVSIPDDYEEDNIKRILANAGITSEEPIFNDKDLALESAGTSTEVKDPNIIIIMSEAFIDITESSELEYSEEILPNYKNLRDNYLSGRVLTPQFGGGTSNSEFEVMTGFANYFLPSGTIAYTNYIGRDTDNYASFLNTSGYTTMAIHPYIRDFFSRDKAYAFFGFKSYLSEESFEGYDTKRWLKFYSDSALSQKIIETYEDNKTTGNPFFNLSVSMQNHAGYGANEFPDEMVEVNTSVGLTEDEMNAISSYSSGISLSDKALGELVDYFSEVDEPTVIIFFGDHAPYLGDDTDKTLEAIGYLDDVGSPEANYRLYSTPYVIWNNFEEEPTVQNANMSMFYLLPYMTNTLSLDRPNYYCYLDSLYETFRAITPNVCLDGDGNILASPTDEMNEKIAEFRDIQYDLLLGEKYSEKYLYPTE